MLKASNKSIPVINEPAEKIPKAEERETVFTLPVTDIPKPSVNQDQADTAFEKFIEEKMNDLRDAGFKPLPRGIHQADAIRCYDEVLNAGEEVLQILREGYSPTWKSGPPPASKLENNMSAKRDLKFVREQLTDWLQQGYVERVQDQPHIVAPLSVNTKVDNATGI